MGVADDAGAGGEIVSKCENNACTPSLPGVDMDMLRLVQRSSEGFPGSEIGSERESRPFERGSIPRLGTNFMREGSGEWRVEINQFSPSHADVRTQIFDGDEIVVPDLMFHEASAIAREHNKTVRKLKGKI